MLLHIGINNALTRIKAPSWEQVYSALKEINKKEGRTFVKLEDENQGSNIFCYGSKRALLMQYTDTSDRNFLLGLGIEKPIETLIQGSSGPVRVQLHEILAVANAYDVFEFFHRASTIPSRYTLRALEKELQLEIA